MVKRHLINFTYDITIIMHWHEREIHVKANWKKKTLIGTLTLIILIILYNYFSYVCNNHKQESKKALTKVCAIDLLFKTATLLICALLGITEINFDTYFLFLDIFIFLERSLINTFMLSALRRKMLMYICFSHTPHLWMKGFSR